jgi:hypothetical protein
MAKSIIIEMGDNSDGHPRIIFITDVGSHRIRSTLYMTKKQIKEISTPLYTEIDHVELLKKISDI